jgi:Ras-related protein Rab-24
VVERFAHGRWNDSLSSTIGGSFIAKEVAWEATGANGKPKHEAVMLGVWDTAGSERFESLTRHYFSQAEAALVCFDLTAHDSWGKVSFWVRAVASACAMRRP